MASLKIEEFNKCFLFFLLRSNFQREKTKGTATNQIATRSYQLTASGTQVEKTLVDGKKFVREVGKLELYLWKKVWLNRE